MQTSVSSGRSGRDRDGAVSLFHVALAILALGLTTLAAQAQAPPPVAAPNPSAAASGLEEIVVTATRRAEPLSKVPESIAALDQQAMDVAGVRNIADIAELTPGVDFGTFAFSNGSQNSIAIRGIRDSLNTEPTTGIYIDDTPVTVRNSQNALFGNPYPLVFDLDRVEVLRGPQGTLFGAGSEAGTVRFISPEPSLSKFTAYSRAELAETIDGEPSYEAGAAAGGPMADGKLGYRVSAWYRKDGGWVDRHDYETGSVTKNSNWSDHYVVRGAFTLAPTDTLRITPSIYYQSSHVADTSQYWESLSNPGEGRYISGNVLPSASSDRFYLPSLKVEADLPGVKLESISSYFYRNGNSVFDGTFFETFAWAGVPYPFIPGQQAPQFNAQSQNILTQEFRFSSTTENSRVSWVAGLFYSGARQADQTLVADPQFGTLIMDVFGLSLEDFFGTGLTDGKYTLVSNDSSKEEQAAVYAHADIKLTDTLDLGLGVRYANTRVKYFEQDGGTVYGTTHSYGGSQTHNPVTPQFSLKYQFQPNKMAYATVAEGYRLGGVNSPIPINPPCTAQLETLGLGSVPPTYNPDTLWNYEVGSKLRFLDNRVSVDFSAFHDVWNHIQQFVALPACGFLGFTGNLGKATSDGFDLDMAVHAGGGFQVELGVGYTHATYSETVGVAPAVVVSKGDTLPGTSPWIVSLTPEYRFTAFGEKQFYLRAQDQFHSHNNGSFPGMNPDSISYDPDIPLPPSRNLLNLRAGMIWSGVDASLFVNNVLNSHPGLQLSHPVAGDPLFSNLTFRPLTVGATLIYRY